MLIAELYSIFENNMLIAGWYKILFVREMV